jgi:hypothetical protein
MIVALLLQSMWCGVAESDKTQNVVTAHSKRRERGEREKSNENNYFRCCNSYIRLINIGHIYGHMHTLCNQKYVILFK